MHWKIVKTTFDKFFRCMAHLGFNCMILHSVKMPTSLLVYLPTLKLEFSWFMTLIVCSLWLSVRWIIYIIYMIYTNIYFLFDILNPSIIRIIRNKISENHCFWNVSIKLSSFKFFVFIYKTGVWLPGLPGGGRWAKSCPPLRHIPMLPMAGINTGCPTKHDSCWIVLNVFFHILYWISTTFCVSFR